MFGSEKITELKKENQELRLKIVELEKKVKNRETAIYGLAAIGRDAIGYITDDEERRKFRDRIEVFSEN